MGVKLFNRDKIVVTEISYIIKITHKLSLVTQTNINYYNYLKLTLFEFKLNSSEYILILPVWEISYFKNRITERFIIY